MKAKVEYLRSDVFSGVSAKNGSPFTFHTAVFFDQETKDQPRVSCTEAQIKALEPMIGKTGVLDAGFTAKPDKLYFIRFAPAA